MKIEFLIIIFITVFNSYSSLLLKRTDFSSGTKWKFLTRFCFQNNATLNITLEFPSSYTNQKLLFYHDGYQSWSQAYNSEMTCEEKVNVLDDTTAQVQELDEYSPFCEHKNQTNQEDLVVCDMNFVFKLRRPTWWFIAMSNCGDERGLKATYSMLMQNGDSLFYRHFSYDEFYVLQASYIFLFIYIALVGVVSYWIHKLRKQRLVTHTYVILLVSVLFNLVQFIFTTSYWFSYGVSGLPLSHLRSIGNGFWILGHSLFVCILLLTSVGYCVVFTVFPKFIAFSLICGVAYVVLQIIVYIFQESTFDPGEIVYRNETAYGISLEILRLILFIVFLAFCSLSAKKFIKRRKFFIIFTVLFGLWFLSMPIMVLLGSLVIVDYVRERVVVMFDFSIAVIGHLIFLILTRPTQSNELVTFMKVGAVGVTMEQAEMQETNSSQEEDVPHGGVCTISNFNTFATTSNKLPNLPAEVFHEEPPPPAIYNPDSTISNFDMMREHIDSLFTTVELQDPNQLTESRTPAITGPMGDKTVDSAFVFPSAM